MSSTPPGDQVRAIDVWTDDTPTGLQSAIEADMVAARLYRADLPVEAHVEADAAWAIAPLPDPYRNVVVRADFEPGTEERRIGEIIASFGQRASQILWWVAPHHRPPDLVSRLSRAGFEVLGHSPAMAIQLDALPRQPIEAPADVLVRPVSNDRGVRDYLSVLDESRPEGGPSSSAPGARLSIAHLSGGLASEPIPLRYVAYLAGEPVATARLSIGGGVAGVYAVVTVPWARRRGLGRWMTLTALSAGRSLGMRIGTLQASDMAADLYRHIGFEEIFTYTIVGRRSG